MKSNRIKNWPKEERPRERLLAVGAAILWRHRLVRDLQEAAALVLRVSRRKLTLSLINRYLRIKAQRLL